MPLDARPAGERTLREILADGMRRRGTLHRDELVRPDAPRIALPMPKPVRCGG
jgi:hypothetical protein